MRTAIWAECLKLRHSRMLWISLLASALMPVMLGLVQAGVLGTANAADSGGTEWEQYLIKLGSMISIGGIIGFGFIFSWLFGREYSDRTVKDLLALPTSRGRIVGAKLLVAAVWCLCLAILAFGCGSFMAGVFRFGGMADHMGAGFARYLETVCMVISLSMPVAWSASAGRGYLSSLGFVVLTMIAAQFSGAMGIAAYFPWSIPSLFSGAAGEESMHLQAVSMMIPYVVGFTGVAAVVAWWRLADQK